MTKTIKTAKLLRAENAKKNHWKEVKELETLSKSLWTMLGDSKTSATETFLSDKIEELKTLINNKKSDFRKNPLAS